VLFDRPDTEVIEPRMKPMKPTRTIALIDLLVTIVVAGLGPITMSMADHIHAGTDAVASPPGSTDTSILPADRATTWNPGMMGEGGIPVRSTVCASLTPRGGGQDDTAQIQGAINACPAGQVVQLAAGTFIINGGNFVLINKGITLRGAGPGQTTLAKTDGAKPYPQIAVGPKPSPLIIVGPSRYGANNGDNVGVVGSTNLTADAVKGANTVTVASPTGFSAGQIVLLDEVSGASWQPDALGRGQIWAAPDWRVVWQKHNPYLQFIDDFAADAFPTTPRSAGQWFSRLDRPTAEVKEIASPSSRPSTFPTGPATPPSCLVTVYLTSGTRASRISS
jgi:hypothetical protein